MATHVAAVTLDLDLQALDQILDETGEHGLPVVDGKGKLSGVVTRLDLARARQQGGWSGRTVQDIASRSVLTAHPDEAMWIAIRRMDTRGVGQLPVVDRRDAGHILGLIRRADIVRAYRIGLGRRLDLRERAVRLEKEQLANNEFVELEVAPDSPLIGQQVRDLALPSGCLLTTLRRGDQVILLNDDTTIRAGDRLTAFAEPAHVHELCQALQIAPLQT
jgi:CIC family chloride channel protein